MVSQCDTYNKECMLIFFNKKARSRPKKKMSEVQKV